MYHKIFLNISDVCTLLKRLTTSWSCLASLLVCCNCYLELSFLFLVSSLSLLPFTFPLYFLTQGAQGLTTLYNHICCLKVSQSLLGDQIFQSPNCERIECLAGILLSLGTPVCPERTTYPYWDNNQSYVLYCLFLNIKNNYDTVVTLRIKVPLLQGK